MSCRSLLCRLALALALSAVPVASLLYVLGGEYYSDTDYYWHIALGHRILQTGTVGGVDMLSWAAQQQGLEYVNHSWLADILLAWLSGLGQTEILGAVLYLTGTLAALSVLVFALWGGGLSAPRRLGHRLADGAVILAVWYCLRMTWGNPRPQQLALVLFALALRLLQKAWQGGKSGWALPVLAVLWANVHGGSICLLLGLTALYGLLALLPPFRVGQLCHRRGAPARNWALLLVLEGLAGCLNPYGPGLYAQFFHVDANSALLGVIEWQPANWSSAPAFFVALALLVLAWLLARHPVPLAEALPLAATAALALLHVRGVAWFVVCLAVFLLRHVGGVRTAFVRLADAAQRKRPAPGLLRRVLLAASRAALPVLAAGSLAGCAWLAPRAVNVQFYRVFSPELVQTLQALVPQRLYTGYNTGGMAIQAGFQSFVDSRAELFTGDMLQDFMVMSGTRPQSSGENINAVLDKYSFDALLFAKYDRGLMISYFDERDDWVLVYDDARYSLFVPADDGNIFAAEYMRLNGQTNPKTGEPYTPLYLDGDTPVEYVAPSDILERIQGGQRGAVLFTDPQNDLCRAAVPDVLAWVQQNDLPGLLVCNIENYRMRYAVDTNGEVVIAQNRTVGYDELLVLMDPILPFYELDRGGETVTLDVKTVEPPMLVQFAGGQVQRIDF